MKKLCVLGSINVDHVIHIPQFPQAGETLTGYDYHQAFGGKGANQAVAAARLGTEVSFIGAIGEDDIGQTMKNSFANEKIDTQGIAVIAGQNTGLAMIQVADTGENSIVISAGANASLDETRVLQHKALIAEADYLLMQLETPLPAVSLAAKFAKETGTKVVLNPAPAKPLPKELLALVDMITPNETEAEILTGVKIVDEQTAYQAAQAFHQFGIELVLITLGEKGVYVSQKAHQVGEIIAGFKVEAKDTTAAGDTFNGALISALMEQKTLNQAIRFAHAAAAISVTRKGAQSSIPYLAEVGGFLSKYHR